jgi:hypothetical protein
MITSAPAAKIKEDAILGLSDACSCGSLSRRRVETMMDRGRLAPWFPRYIPNVYASLDE